MDKYEKLRVWIRERVDDEEVAFTLAGQSGDTKTMDECDNVIWAYSEVLAKIKRMQND